MVLRRAHSEAEIAALAEKFRESWSDGQLIRSWLRRHGEELRLLVRDEDWAWVNIGKAMALAGIRFRTGNAWTGENLRRSVDLAMKPRKGRTQEPTALVSTRPDAKGEPEFRVIRRGFGSMPAGVHGAPAISDADAIAIAQGHPKRGDT